MRMHARRDLGLMDIVNSNRSGGGRRTGQHLHARAQRARPPSQYRRSRRCGKAVPKCGSSPWSRARRESAKNAEDGAAKIDHWGTLGDCPRLLRGSRQHSIGVTRDHIRVSALPWQRSREMIVYQDGTPLRMAFVVRHSKLTARRRSVTCRSAMPA